MNNGVKAEKEIPVGTVLHLARDGGMVFGDKRITILEK